MARSSGTHPGRGDQAQIQVTAPAGALEHLTGGATLRQLLAAQGPDGARAAALDLHAEVPELIGALRAERLHDLADDLQVLADAVSDNFRRQGCRVIPVRSKGSGILRLAVLSRWQTELRIAALLERDDLGVRVKLPGEMHLDRLQAVCDEYPIR